jgi:hypothetical protein
LRLILNQKTKSNNMKRCIFLLTVFFCFQLTVIAQKSKTDQSAPKEDIHVNREFDENGNLIKFDSVYSYSWSSDTTLLKSLSPENFPNLFNDHLGFAPDSTFLGNSFFGDFDHLFSSPFNDKKDSVLMRKFGLNKHFQDLYFNNDSLAMNLKDFDDLFNSPGKDKNDSISSKSKKPSQFHSNSRSMNEMMKMLQQQMKEMEEYQERFFKNQPGWK